MRTRFFFVGALALIAVSCRRAPKDADAYWSRLDALYIQAAQTFSAAYPSPTPEGIAHLQSLRDEIAQLPHPASANHYHELKLAEIDSGIQVLTARRDRDMANAEIMDRKLIDTRRQAYDERKRIRPADSR